MVISNSQTGPQLAEAFPQIADGARAAAMQINDAGGVNGKHIKIEPCETQGNPNTAVQCAQRAVSEHLPAVVGSFDLANDYLAVLERAKIPSIAPWVTNQVTVTSPISYPVTGGGYANTAGQISLLASQGATTVAAVYSSVSAAGAPQALAPIEATRPNLKINQVIIPANTVDFSAVVADAHRNAGIGMFALPNDIVSFVRALRQSGASLANVDTASDALLPASLKELGSTAEGMSAVASFYPPSATNIPAVAQFDKYMDKIDPTASKDGFAENAYAGVELFAQAVKGLSSVTATSLSQQLDKGGPFNIGLLPAVSFKKSMSPTPQLTRMFNADVIYLAVKNGIYVMNDGGFVNAYTGKPVG